MWLYCSAACVDANILQNVASQYKFNIIIISMYASERPNGLALLHTASFRLWLFSKYHSYPVVSRSVPQVVEYVRFLCQVLCE